MLPTYRDIVGVFVGIIATLTVLRYFNSLSIAAESKSHNLATKTIDHAQMGDFAVERMKYKRVDPQAKIASSLIKESEGIKATKLLEETAWSVVEPIRINRDDQAANIARINYESVKNPIPHGGKCSIDRISSIAAKKPTKNSYCPQREEWVSEYIKTLSSAAPTVMTIGCNIADDFLSTVREISRNSTYSLRSMKPYYAEIENFHVCPKPVDTEINEVEIRPVRAFCIEPVQSNAKILRRAFGELGWDSEITFIQTAVSSFLGTTIFADMPPGTSNIGMESYTSSSKSSYEVHVTTLDALAAQHGIATIDLLSIDTEGTDMRVIFGGIRTLPRVRLVEFEYHNVNHWRESSLEDLVDLLDQVMRLPRKKPRPCL